MMDKPIMVFKKNTERGTNKMIIPKAIVEQWGRNYQMEIYQDKLILRPTKEEK